MRAAVGWIRMIADGSGRRRSAWPFMIMATRFAQWSLNLLYGLSLAQAEPYSSLEWHQIEEDANCGWESYNKTVSQYRPSQH